MTEKESNTYKNDRTGENGRRNPMQTEQRKERNIKSKRQKMTDADSAGRQIGRDDISVQQIMRNVEIPKEEAITKRCAEQQTSTIRRKNSVIGRRRQLGIRQNLENKQHKTEERLI